MQLPVPVKKKTQSTNMIFRTFEIIHVKNCFLLTEIFLLNHLFGLFTSQLSADIQNKVTEYRYVAACQLAKLRKTNKKNLSKRCVMRKVNMNFEI